MFPATSIIFLVKFSLTGVEPYPFPQTYTSPLCVNAIVIYLYASIFTMLVKPSTFTGVNTFCVSPVPHCP